MAAQLTSCFFENMQSSADLPIELPKILWLYSSHTTHVNTRKVNPMGLI